MNLQGEGKNSDGCEESENAVSQNFGAVDVFGSVDKSELEISNNRAGSGRVFFELQRGELFGRICEISACTGSGDFLVESQFDVVADGIVEENRWDDKSGD